MAAAGLATRLRAAAARVAAVRLPVPLRSGSCVSSMSFGFAARAQGKGRTGFKFAG